MHETRLWPEEPLRGIATPLSESDQDAGVTASPSPEIGLCAELRGTGGTRPAHEGWPGASQLIVAVVPCSAVRWP